MTQMTQTLEASFVQEGPTKYNVSPAQLYREFPDIEKHLLITMKEQRVTRRVNIGQVIGFQYCWRAPNMRYFDQRYVTQLYALKISTTDWRFFDDKDLAIGAKSLWSIECPPNLKEYFFWDTVLGAKMW